MALSNEKSDNRFLSVRNNGFDNTHDRLFTDVDCPFKISVENVLLIIINYRTRVKDNSDLHVMWCIRCNEYVFFLSFSSVSCVFSKFICSHMDVRLLWVISHGSTHAKVSMVEEIPYKATTGNIYIGEGRGVY